MTVVCTMNTQICLQNYILDKYTTSLIAKKYLKYCDSSLNRIVRIKMIYIKVQTHLSNKHLLQCVHPHK